MNLILFHPDEQRQPLPLEDPRARHILRVLQCQVGDRLDVGLIDGPRGKAELRAITAQGVFLEFTWSGRAPALHPLILIVGLSRPQTSRRILREAAAMGVGRMFFVLTARAEASYAASRLWSTGEFRRHVLAGVEQAFTTRVPAVEYGMPLSEVLPRVLAMTPVRCALDNYEATVSLADLELGPDASVALAVGSERGWTARERDVLRSHGFVLAGMGERVLRTETAVVAGLAVIQAKLGLWA